MTTGWRYVLQQFMLLALIAFLACLFLAIGLVIGYAFIGDGQDPLSILSVGKLAELISKFTGK